MIIDNHHLQQLQGVIHQSSFSGRHTLWCRVALLPASREQPLPDTELVLILGESYTYLYVCRKTVPLWQFEQECPSKFNNYSVMSFTCTHHSVSANLRTQIAGNRSSRENPHVRLGNVGQYWVCIIATFYRFVSVVLLEPYCLHKLMLTLWFK